VSRSGVLRVASFALPAVAAPVLVVLATRRDGLNLSPDSVAYLAAAEGLAKGAGVVGLDGEPQSLYAPGLSWLLALPADAGVAVDAARALNLLTLAALVFGLGWWLDRCLRRSVAVVAAAAAAIAAPLLAVHEWLWSEPPYILLTAVYLAILVRIASRDSCSTRWVVAAGLVAAAATLVRYAGLSVLPVAALVLLLRPVPPRRRITGAAAFGVAYAVPVGVWLVRDVVLTGEPTGERVPTAVPAGEVLHDGVLTMARWLTPEDLPLPVRLWLAALLAAGVVVLAVAAARHRSADARATVLAVLVGYVLTAFLVLFAMAASANVNELGPRLLSPLLVPLIALLAVSADVVLDRLSRAGRAICAVAMVGAVAWCLLPATVRHVSAAGDDVLSFSRGSWQAEDTRELAAAVPTGANVVSNDPWGVYYLTRRAVAESPRARYHASALVPPDDLDDLARAVQAGPTYLVWFDRPASDYHYTPAELEHSFRLTPVEHSRAGVVYRVGADEGT
jgi:hypothetical protein